MRHEAAMAPKMVVPIGRKASAPGGFAVVSSRRSSCRRRPAPRNHPRLVGYLRRLIRRAVALVGGVFPCNPFMAAHLISVGLVDSAQFVTRVCLYRDVVGRGYRRGHTAS